MTDLGYESIAQAADKLSRGEISSVQLTEACLARISVTEGVINAFITVTAEQALADARTADARIAKGESRGLLNGIPIGLKDLIDVAGIPTTAGGKTPGRLPTRDADVAARLKAAGAVLIGKHNMQQFALGPGSEKGLPHNPWDTSRATGGSSSGSAASVAAGQCLGAIGSDTGGSIRIPASLCGVVGHKPTYSLVSNQGVVPLSWSLDHLGPLARTVEDGGLLLQTLAGEASPAGAVASQRESRLEGVRVGVPTNFFFDRADAEVTNAVRAAIDVLRGLGAKIVELEIPVMNELLVAHMAIQQSEAAAYHQRNLKDHPELYAEPLRQRLERTTYLATDYIQAHRVRTMAVAAWQEKVFLRADVIVTPTTETVAPEWKPTPTSLHYRDDMDATESLIRLVSPINLLGAPAISVPCGFSEAGLPIGLQVIGRWWEDAIVLRTAHAYERAAGWYARRPALDL